MTCERPLPLAIGSNLVGSQYVAGQSQQHAGYTGVAVQIGFNGKWEQPAHMRCCSACNIYCATPCSYASDFYTV